MFKAQEDDAFEIKLLICHSRLSGILLKSIRKKQSICKKDSEQVGMTDRFLCHCLLLYYPLGKSEEPKL
jgi:hypothetical protein